MRFPSPREIENRAARLCEQSAIFDAAGSWQYIRHGISVYLFLFMSNYVEDVVPTQPLLILGAGDKGHGDIPLDLPEFVSYRVTTDDNEVVYDVFKGCECVIGEEVSKNGVKHFHVVVAGLDRYEIVKKRLVRAKLGVNKWWSKKNHGDFLKAVSYTVKCGDYVTRRGFHRYVDMAPEWVFGQHLNVVSDDVKDTDKDWLLTWNNLLRVTLNWRTKHKLTTTSLSGVLEHMTQHSRWVPSPQMLKNGLDPWHHRMFTYRVTQQGRPPSWWEPRSESTPFVFKD